jgi:hypothetical protein
LIERSENVAVPLAAATGVVPESTPEPGFVPSATAIGANDVVTTLPDESSTLMATLGVIVRPSAVFEGWVEKANCVATPEMSKLGLVAPDRLELDAVKVTPEAYTLPEQPEKVATPPIGVFVVPDVQLSDSPPLIVSVIDDA